MIKVNTSVQSLWRLLNLLYFGNLNQTLTDFVLRDLGLYRYHNLVLTPADRGFENRAMLDRHLAYYLLLERLHAGTSRGKTTINLDAAALIELASDFDQLLRQDDRDMRLSRRSYRQLLAIARQLERLDDDTAALSIYSNVPRHPARERIIRILSKAPEKLPQALGVCQRAWLEPYNDDERAFLETCIPRLLKRLQKLHPDAQAAWFVAPEPVIEQGFCLTSEQRQHLGQRGFIETAALQYLGEQQTGQGFHVENALFCAVFGLTFWPVIFAPVSGAFFHPFQSQPDDYGESDFWHKREAYSNRIWQKIYAGTWKQELTALRKNHLGVVNPLVHWSFVEYACESGLWQLALERISNADWVSIFRYLAGDLTSRSRGMPDLIWFPDGGGYQLFEVKGPGDALRQSQVGWLRYLQKMDIDAKVLHTK